MKPLSPRERQIVALVAQGRITRNTIRTYMARIFLKAGVESSMQLGVAAAKGCWTRLIAER
jgi:DNA-binding CsgD family transcriptional regulator